MRVSSYTAQFAERFALPPTPAGAEPTDGIQALEFSVEKVAFAPERYTCKLSVFLGAGTPVSYPEGHLGTRNLPSYPSALLSPSKDRWSRWSNADKARFHERPALYRRNARLASSDFSWNQRGWSVDLVYDEYHRQLFSGIAYIKLDIGCGNVRHVKSHTDVQLWLKREGGKDYTTTVKIDPDDFLKFGLSPGFLDLVVPLWRAAERHNAKLNANKQGK